MIEREHSEQPVLETLIGLVFGKVPDEFDDLDSDFLCHSLNTIIKLGLTYYYSLESEMRFCLNVVRPEQGSFNATALSRSVQK